MIALGLLETWASRSAMQSDGISYLDMGDAMMRGDWHMALNGYWSPLYPLMLGASERMVRARRVDEFTTVHFVNYVIFLICFICFDYFLRELWRTTSARRTSSEDERRLPEWMFFSLGYAIFGYVVLSMIGMDRVSPDLLMAAFVFLAIGFLVRIRTTAVSWREFALLGICLGLGYLAKAPMLPLAILVAMIASVAARARTIFARVCVIAVPFVLLAGSWIAAVSMNHGRLIVSESGRINFILWVNHASPSWYFRILEPHAAPISIPYGSFAAGRTFTSLPAH
ncbi:MAG: DUF2142 domain-containing protein [Acidobacteriaceae bacterium]|nr:DUF2142 domain-containing protein [Acidobacteriaceae bacterium]